MTLKSGTVALVGRPNVGKSTLFNRLCGGRDALVHDRPGLTRDRKYGRAQFGDRNGTVIDTGGLHDTSDIANLVNAQVRLAIEEADIVVVLLDAAEGLTAADEIILQELRALNKPMRLVANKMDGVKQAQLLALGALSGLGFGDVLFVSATHGDGVSALRDALEPYLTRVIDSIDHDGIPVAVIGRPNVGKSTLVNAFLGDDRCVVFDEPGTTRDSIYIPFERDDQRYVLIDTAGIRRKGRVQDVVEKFSVVKALDAMVAAEVALLVIDATEGIVEQDLHIISYAVEAGTGLILVVNKVDAMDAEQRRVLKKSLTRRLRFAEWIPVHHTSALKQTGIKKLYTKVRQVHRSGRLDVTTPDLNRVLQRAVESHAPPAVRSRQVKIRYVNKLHDHPPTLLVHGNQVEALPPSYRRYLENRFRTALEIVGMPIAIEFRDTENPFGHRRNELTRRQQKHRQRLIQRRKARAKAKRSRA